MSNLLITLDIRSISDENSTEITYKNFNNVEFQASCPDLRAGMQAKVSSMLGYIPDEWNHN